MPSLSPHFSDNSNYQYYTLSSKDIHLTKLDWEQLQYQCRLVKELVKFLN